MKADKTGVITVGGKKYYAEDSKLKGSTNINNAVINGNDGKWYCIDNDGNVAKPSNNLAGNENGIWYVKDDGSVDFTKKGVVDTVAITAYKNIPGLAASKKAYIEDGYVRFDKTGFYDDGTNKNFVKDGIVDNTWVGNDEDNVAVKGLDGKYYAVKRSSTTLVATTLAANKTALIANKISDTETQYLCFINKEFVAGTTGIVTVNDTADGVKTVGDYYVINGVFQDKFTGTVRFGGVDYTVVNGVATH